MWAGKALAHIPSRRWAGVASFITLARRSQLCEREGKLGEGPARSGGFELIDRTVDRLDQSLSRSDPGVHSSLRRRLAGAGRLAARRGQA